MVLSVPSFVPCVETDDNDKMTRQQVGCADTDSRQYTYTADRQADRHTDTG